jgi:hypothetical protein
MNTAEHTPRGMAIRTAMTATITVPLISPRTPMRLGLVSVRHSVVVKKSRPIVEKASRPRSSRKSPTRPRITKTLIPAVIVTPPKILSVRVGASMTSRFGAGPSVGLSSARSETGTRATGPQ